MLHVPMFQACFLLDAQSTDIIMQCLLLVKPDTGAAWQMLCLKWCMSTNTAYGSQMTNTASLETSCTAPGFLQHFHNTPGSCSWWRTDQMQIIEAFQRTSLLSVTLLSVTNNNV